MRKYFLPGCLVLLDILVLVFTAFFSLYLRFDALIINTYFTRVTYVLPVFIIIYVFFFNAMHVYTRIWKYAGTREVAAIVSATTMAAVLLWKTIFCIGVQISQPRYAVP